MSHSLVMKFVFSDLKDTDKYLPQIEAWIKENRISFVEGIDGCSNSFFFYMNSLEKKKQKRLARFFIESSSSLTFVDGHLLLTYSLSPSMRKLFTQEVCSELLNDLYDIGADTWGEGESGNYKFKKISESEKQYTYSEDDDEEDEDFYEKYECGYVDIVDICVTGDSDSDDEDSDSEDEEDDEEDDC